MASKEISTALYFGLAGEALFFPNKCLAFPSSVDALRRISPLTSAVITGSFAVPVTSKGIP